MGRLLSGLACQERSSRQFHCRAAHLHRAPNGMHPPRIFPLDGREPRDQRDALHLPRRGRYRSFNSRSPPSRGKGPFASSRCPCELAPSISRPSTRYAATHRHRSKTAASNRFRQVCLSFCSPAISKDAAARLNIWERATPDLAFQILYDEQL
jgi:hypothetical protein